MTVEENKDLVRRYVEEGVIKVAQGDMAAIHEFLADDFVNHTPLLHDLQAKGTEHMATNIQEAGNALPDMRLTADIILAEGDVVAVHYTAGGTHTGTAQHRHIDQIQPSGQEVQMSGLAIYRVRDGKLTEMWNYDNHMDVLMQLGQLSAVG
jgi:predicted ester cyclase